MRDGDVAVFDQLDLIETSGIPTWQAEVVGATDADFTDLEDLLPDTAAIDNWSTMRMLCADCSHGDGDHDHQPTSVDSVLVGLAGHEHELRTGLNQWLSARPHIVVPELTFLW